MNHPALKIHKDIKMELTYLKCIAESADPERKDPLWKKLKIVTAK